MDDEDCSEKPNGIIGNNSKTKKKKKRGGSKRKMSVEQTVAYKSVSEWVYLGQSSSSCVAEDDDYDFGVQWGRPKEKLVFEFHSHSIHSDGFLSPTKLVERAHQNGVKVLALTDHDTMSGIPEALDAASRFGIKILPGVEVSSVFSPRDSGPEEPVHILAYYGICGPARNVEMDKFLADIRNGRFIRAKSMVMKLNKLKLPLKWEQVAKIAGNGVAPGRLHVARALVEAGHVESLKQAFARYLYDDGPAYSTGSEPNSEEAVKMICQTGGVAVLAHPWALKNPVPIIRRLKEAGLHGIEAYRSDGKLAVFSDLADAYSLVKLGGSDYHGKVGQQESDLGSVNLPISLVHQFLKVARPIWYKAFRDIMENHIKDGSTSNIDFMIKIGRTRLCKRLSPCATANDLINHCSAMWLTKEERLNPDFEAIKQQLSNILINEGVA